MFAGHKRKRPVKKKPQPDSHLERLVEIMLDYEVIEHERKVKGLIPGRKFEFDFRIKHTNILLEIQGGAWIPGRHNLGQHIEDQYEKMNLAIIYGFFVLQYGTDTVKKNPFKIISDIKSVQLHRHK